MMTRRALGYVHVDPDAFTAHAWFFVGQASSPDDEPDITVDLQFDQGWSSPYRIMTSHRDGPTDTEHYNGWTSALRAFLDRLADSIEGECG